MADISAVFICNLALQRLGAARITSVFPPDDSTNARAANANYDFVRDRELRAHTWNFAKKRAILTPSAVVPLFGYEKAFPVPVDFLRLLPPARHDLDWRIESNDGRMAILTNDGDTLEIEYVASITDPTRFDLLFVDALSLKLAWQLCEQLTQSNAKQEGIMQAYRISISEARRTNAIESVSADPPDDPWYVARL